jgi:hypothetical protein
MNLQNRSTVLYRAVPRGTILVMIHDPSADHAHNGYTVMLALTTRDQRHGFSMGVAHSETEALEMVEDLTDVAYERAVRGGVKTTHHTMLENLVQATLL